MTLLLLIVIGGFLIYRYKGKPTLRDIEVKNRKTKYEYALKQIPLEKIINDKLVDSLETEKSVLLNIDHPFVVNLIKGTRDTLNIEEEDNTEKLDLKNKNYYLIMEYIKGKNFSS